MASHPYDVLPLPLDNIVDFIDAEQHQDDDLIIDVPGRAGGDDVFNALTACDAVTVPLVWYRITWTGPVPPNLWTFCLAASGTLLL